MRRQDILRINNKPMGLKGFTLIELLIVIAIIGLLAAIAIPTFLGQRERAKVRTVVAGAKGAVTYVQGILDAKLLGEPYIVLGTDGNEDCVESNTAAYSKSCWAIYSQSDDSTYASISDVITDIVGHYEGKGWTNPYDSSENLLHDGSTTLPDEGRILLTNSSESAITIRGYMGGGTIVFNTTVTSL